MSVHKSGRSYRKKEKSKNINKIKKNESNESGDDIRNSEGLPKTTMKGLSIPSAD